MPDDTNHASSEPDPFEQRQEDRQREEPGDSLLPSAESRQKNGVSQGDVKIRYLRTVREKYIDPLTSHPLYSTFVRFLEQHETNTHYPRFALTMAEMLNTMADFFSATELAKKSVCETGSLSVISQFLVSQGCPVRGTHTDLRYAIDAADESFDLLLSLEVLEHIKDQTEKVFGDIVLFNGSGAQKFVDEIWRVVRPGGLVILTTPNPTCLLALIKLIGYEPPMVYRPHVREYTKGEICKLFDKFKLVKYCSFFAYGYIGIGEQKAREYVERLGWDPADRGDCHFFVFQRPDAV